jgi:hypothetical protein
LDAYIMIIQLKKTVKGYFAGITKYIKTVLENTSVFY